MKYLKKEKKKSFRSQIWMWLVHLTLEGTLIIFFLAILFNNISAGWFASNKEVSANGMSVSVQNNDTNVNYKVFQYNADTIGTIEKIHMKTYDSIFTHENKNNAAVIRAEITGTTDLPRSGIMHFTIKRDTARDTDTTKLTSLASNLLRFTVAAGRNLYADGINQQYENVENLLGKDLTGTAKWIDDQYGGQVTGSMVGDSKVFAHQNGDSFTKDESIDISVKYTADDWIGDHLYLYLYVSYDHHLVDIFGQNKKTEGMDLNHNNISVANDLVSISMRAEAAENKEGKDVVL